MAAKRRLGAPVIFAVLSLICIACWLPRSRTHLSLGHRIWAWEGAEEEVPSPKGLRIVVLGDSWVDSAVEAGHEGREKSWTEVLCAQMNCTSHLNLARSQPSTAYPSAPPTGAVVSNRIHEHFESPSPASLPDLRYQIEEFMKLPPKQYCTEETIFVVSFGFWDVYHYASLDSIISQPAMQDSITEFFVQLDVLYNYFRSNLPPPQPQPQNSTFQNSTFLNSSATTTDTSSFRVIIPKLFDPTLLPGWLSERPSPQAPVTIAEHQKNAVHLTAQWNLGLEDRFAQWMVPHDLVPVASVPFTPEENPTSKRKRSSENQPTQEEQTDGEKREVKEPLQKPQKEVFYYDLPSYLLTQIINQSLLMQNLRDGLGLGTFPSLYEDIYFPCVSDDDVDGDLLSKKEMREVNGRLVCNEPRRFLWWDGWKLGPVANEDIGALVAGLVREGGGLRKAWKEAGKSGFR